MINPADFFAALTQSGVGYFTGVPDSLLKTFCAYVTDNTEASNHVIAANEGAAVGLAVGYHLATGQIPLVYLQNSGLGNTINPLTSLVDAEVYSIPMLLMVGWRGEPGVKDEPQHVKQGRITLDMLESMQLPYTVIDGTEPDIDAVVSAATASAKELGSAHFLVVRKGSFDSYKMQAGLAQDFGWNREDAIKAIVDQLGASDIVVATTGMASRELFECRVALGQSHEQDFLTVGGMGHASQIALGIASQKEDRQIVCIDGDGAALMHLGSMAINGMANMKNFKHIIINNGAHDSVGGQPTVAFDIDLPKIAEACGYRQVNTCDSSDTLTADLKSFFDAPGPSVLEIKVNKGNRSDLGRPTTTPKQNKQAFMSFVQS
ncbi:phosphonopyruvate decarboxylase [Oceanicoccus sagamiensis]|uniref:Phosphonopyruvate decarboxylase n=1 Tax=Oceanicoccus sagamiensis TaxID=716816 RepID=A0A1X9N855_9GAMM|nr:phosphonopyruvate decarboxylase [Oceanicoccus sagamiensis]ARN73866.1 phosphonopyruvate decarboxylase [Oceanicoccus sagamiensis]